MIILPDVWFDTRTLNASLVRGERQAQLKGENGVRILKLRDGLWTHPDLQKWAAAKNTLTRCYRLVAQRWPQYEIVRAVIEMLEPGTVVPWSKQEEPDMEARVGIFGNPGCMMFEGVQGANLMTGAVAVRDLRLWHALANLGQGPQLHLVLILRKREIDE